MEKMNLLWFILETDASLKGLGAVLSQTFFGVVISCCDMGHVGDVGDIADMPIGCNAIIVEDVEDKTLTSK